MTVETRDHFGEVRKLGNEGGEIFGAADYFDGEREKQVTPEVIASLCAEINRLSKLLYSENGVDQKRTMLNEKLVEPRNVTARERRLRARIRRHDGKLGLIEYIRVLLWITFRSGRTDRADAERIRQEATTDKKRRKYVAYQTVHDAISDKRYDQAYIMIRSVLEADENDTEAIALLQTIQAKRGCPSSVLGAYRRLAQKKYVNPDAIRTAEGRLREISGWYPKIAGPVEPLTPRDDITVLHLVKESRPYHSNGFAARSQWNFLAEKQSGLRPVVVTELGYPRRSGITDYGMVESVNGIDHYRIDNGCAESNVPVDIWLTEFAQAAYRVLRDVRPAVIHVSSGRRGYETALVGIALAEKAQLPLVYEVRSFFESTWTADTEREEKGETFLRRQAVEQLCMDRADLVLTLCESMREELVRRGVSPKKVGVVPNGVDVEVFFPQNRNVDLAETLGIGKRQTFGYVSNFDHQRESQETLVEAVAELHARGRNDVCCVLVGDGARRAEVEQRAKNLGVSESVIFVGAVDHDEISHYYSLIDMFVVPRINERAARYVTPLKPFEAMSLARPVVASDLPALREIVAPPERGLTFTAGDALSLANVLERLFDNPEEARIMGESGSRWVRQERQWRMNGPRYTAYFAQARKNHARRLHAG